MKHEDILNLGWHPVAKDEKSYVVKKPLTDTAWHELFYCEEKNFVQVMEAVKGEKGEVKRYTKYEGDYVGTDFWFSN